MTAANSANQPQDELMPAQEKLEWVTPKISLMAGGETDGEPKEFDQAEDDPRNSGPS
jgi:hypothetical protein